MGEKSIKSMKSRTQKGVIVNEYMCVQGGGGLKKSVIRQYVLNGWPQTNVYFLCIGPAKYIRASLPARKMLFSSIIITITLSYAIIRIYTILQIYLQFSITKELIGLNVVVKINLPYFQGISLAPPRIRRPSLNQNKI